MYSYIKNKPPTEININDFNVTTIIIANLININLNNAAILTLTWITVTPKKE